MHDFAIFWDWLSFGVRWLHVVTAIAWIGSSFYFTALAPGLWKTQSLPLLAHGEEWPVYGGGSHHYKTDSVGPVFLLDPLTPSNSYR